VRSASVLSTGSSLFDVLDAVALVAIIPARGGSKRLPRKNVLPFGGLPLILWSVRFARALPQFDRVVVSTDSEEIADVCRADGQQVDFLRSAELSGDVASSVDVTLDVLNREAESGRHYDTAALLQPTSPVRYADRWTEAIQLLAAGSQAAIGVAAPYQHPYQMFTRKPDGHLAPREGVDKLAIRSQDLPKVYSVIGNLYLVRTQVLSQEKTFFPARTAGVVCDRPVEQVDIDEPHDWVLAEALVQHLGIHP
jgi:CMP-N-acetylneuraminic acid synthetase